jgi:hypothetical protein
LKPTGLLNSRDFYFPDKSLNNATLVSADKFGTVTWLALDDTIITKSRKSLITISTRQQNTGMIWDGITSVHDNWGTAPTEIEPMNLALELNIEADSIRIYPLNTLGAYNPTDYYSYVPVTPNKFSFTLDQNTDKTCWYGIITYIGSGSLLSTDAYSTYRIGYIENYPNPFTGKTTIHYLLPKNTDTELRIFDINGKEIYFQKTTSELAGEHEREITFKSGTEGILFYNFKTNTGVLKGRMVIVK